MVAEADTAPVRILVVCTANRCRSPLTGALLRAAIEARDPAVELATAGLRGTGRRVTDEAATLGARRGLDLGRHRSRPVTAGLVTGADLLIGMERAHVREVVAIDPLAWPRSFTLKELVRRGEAVGPRRREEPIADWLDRVGEGRVGRDLLGSSPDDDVPDPTGGPIAEHEDLVAELDEQLGRLVALAWPPGPLPA
ncbi:MAG: hypothetical protein R6X23_00965 [Acidimicrobiia bacterium]